MALTEDLQRFIDGDMTLLRAVAREDHDDLRQAADSLPPLVLRANAVLRVLLALQASEIASPQVEEWASFVHAGMFPALGHHVSDRRPIAVALDQRCRAEVASILDRFERVTDDPDDAVSDGELQDMIDQMKLCAA